MPGQFQLPISFDLGAIFIFGLTGALAAIRRGYDLIGLFALTFVTAVGGALIRDGIFIQQGPPGIMSDSQYLLTVLLAGFVGLLFREPVERCTKLIAWLDALGLGAYGVVGVQKALAAHMSVEAAILVGVINAGGGGLLRDVLVREEPLVFQAGQFYLLAVLAGCALFPLLTAKLMLSATHAALVCIAVTFLLRVLAIQFNWRTSALSEPPDPARR